jgi:amylovoran biosynthesis glycosyltransferase AmsE
MYQTYIPEDIVLIIDGPISDDLLATLDHWKRVLPLSIFSLEMNMGLAYALNYGLKLCINDWVFRMDMDDVCSKDRFRKQRDYIVANPEIDILGGNILCFESFSNPYSCRKVPLSFSDIKRFLKFRNPLNHPTVFFNRTKILSINGYPNARFGQDYLLWIRAINSGMCIVNMKDVLVLMQVDRKTFSRRGITNLRYDLQSYKLMYDLEMTSFFEFCLGFLFRLIYSVYASCRSLVQIVYFKFSQSGASNRGY